MAAGCVFGRSCAGDAAPARTQAPASHTSPTAQSPWPAQLAAAGLATRSTATNEDNKERQKTLLGIRPRIFMRRFYLRRRRCASRMRPFATQERCGLRSLETSRRQHALTVARSPIPVRTSGKLRTSLGWKEPPCASLLQRGRVFGTVRPLCFVHFGLRSWVFLRWRSRPFSLPAAGPRSLLLVPVPSAAIVIPITPAITAWLACRASVCWQRLLAVVGGQADMTSHPRIPA